MATGWIFYLWGHSDGASVEHRKTEAALDEDYADEAKLRDCERSLSYCHSERDTCQSELEEAKLRRRF